MVGKAHGIYKKAAINAGIGKVNLGTDICYSFLDKDIIHSAVHQVTTHIIYG